MVEALLQARADVLLDLLTAGADPNLSSYPVSGLTALTPFGYAIWQGQIDAVKFLASFGAVSSNVLCTEQPQSALTLAANRAFPEVVAHLVSLGQADPEAVLSVVKAERPDDDPRSVVDFRNDQVEVLVQLASGSFQPKGAQAQTAMLLAVNKGRVDLAKALLAADVSTEITDPSSTLQPTLLLLAALNADRYMVDALIKAGASVKATDSLGNGVVSYAAVGGSVDVLSLTLGAGAAPGQNTLGQTPLMLATSADVVAPLIAAGVEVNAKDSLGRTALSFAVNPTVMLRHPNAKVLADTLAVAGALLLGKASTSLADNRGITPLLAVARNRRAERLQMTALLLKHGAPVSATDESGNSALHLFADTGSVDVIRDLLKAGASLTATDRLGRTTLMRLILADEVSAEAKPDLVNALLSMKFDAAATDQQGRNGLHMVAEAFEGSTGAKLATLLLAAGADPNWLSSADRTPLMEAVFAGNVEVATAIADAPSTNVDTPQHDGRTAFAIAAELSDSPRLAGEMVQLLAGRRVDVNHADRNGMTPLLAALAAGQEGNALFILSTPTVAPLQADNAGTTPLMAAAAHDLHSASTELLATGSDICAVNNEDERAIDLTTRPRASIDPSALLPVENYVAVVEQYERDLDEWAERLRRLEHDVITPGFPSGPEIRPLGLDPDIFRPRFPEPSSLFSSAEYRQAQMMCLVSAPVVSFRPSATCVAGEIRFAQLRDLEQRRLLATPRTWQNLWSLDTIFAKLGLVTRDRLPLQPGSNTPVAADFPNQSDLDSAFRYATDRALSATCDGRDVYHSAARFGIVPVLNGWHAQGLSLTALAQSGETASSLAQQAGHTDAVLAIAANADNALLSRGVALTADAFLDAINLPDGETALLFVESSLDKNATADTRITPLMAAAGNGRLDISVLRNLLIRGADPDLQDDDGSTALMHAAVISNVPAGKALYEFKADIGLRDHDGHTARQLAELNGNTDFVAWLDSLD